MGVTSVSEEPRGADRRGADARIPRVGFVCSSPMHALNLPGSLLGAGVPLPPLLETAAAAPGTAEPAAVAEAYAEAAGRLVERGAALVTTDCAWNLEIAEDIKRGAGEIPVLASVLYVLPLLVKVFHTVGIVSIRAARLREVLKGSDLHVEIDALQVAEIADDSAWRNVGPGSHADLAVLEDELVGCGLKLIDEGAANALVLDCAGFVPFAHAVQERCGVPTFGQGGVVQFLMGSGAR
ncbi:MAG: hypothetical protein V7607_5691 [Solirubrobacteraceae bacterium]